MDNLDTLVAQGQNHGPMANAFQIEDDKAYELAGAMVKSIKYWLKQTDEILDPTIKDAHQHHKGLVAQKREVQAKSKTALSIVKQKMSAYVWKRRQIAAEQQKKLEEAAKEQGVDQALIPQVPTKQPPKVKGVSYRKQWGFTIEDFAKLPDEYKLPDESKLRRIIEAHKGKIKISGVSITEIDPSMAVRS